MDSGRSFPDDTTGFFKDTVLLSFLNRTQEELQNRMVQAHENLFVTQTTINIVDGTDYYSLPSGCLKIVRVEDVQDTNNPIEIYPISFNDKEKFNTKIGITQVSYIANYAIVGNLVVFRPKPARTVARGVKIWYAAKAPALSSGSDISILPEEYHELLSWGIVKKGLIMGESTGDSIAAANAEYARLYNEMILSIEDRQIQKPRYVKRNKQL